MHFQNEKFKNDSKFRNAFGNTGQPVFLKNLKIIFLLKVIFLCATCPCHQPTPERKIKSILNRLDILISKIIFKI
jgi:hypothetical protein